MSRDEALSVLKVRPQTLYAYVSRGQVGRQHDPAHPSRNLYRGDDILALVNKREQGRRTAAVAQSALAWGEPVIPTTISTVMRGELIFRGRRATDLAACMSLEEVASLLWDVPGLNEFPVGAAHDNPFEAIARLVAISHSLLGRPRLKIAAEAAACVAAIGGAFGAVGEGPMHERFARAWRLDAGCADVLRRALVLLADHELNPSTFATRVAASTGASMPACILAGLATLSGPRHGGAGAALAALVAEAANGDIEGVLGRWLATGRQVPGFGHPLYPFGDPRAVALLEVVATDVSLRQLMKTVAEMLDLKPNIDFALLALARANGLPNRACLALFAAARAVGWAAHAMEQAASVAFIRPRARYEGAVAASSGVDGTKQLVEPRPDTTLDR